MRPGEIHHHRRFYADRETGELRGKFLLVLAVTHGGDIVVRLLTSRQHGRPKTPPCFQGDPYPGFHFGVLGGPLNRETWLDLRPADDIDPFMAERDRRKGDLELTSAIPHALLRPAAECVAGARDTTRAQERAIRDFLASL